MTDVLLPAPITPRLPDWRPRLVAYLARVTATPFAYGTLDDYPMIAGEVGVTAPSAWQLSQLWLNMSERFRFIGAATERPRQIALNAIATAPDESTLQEAETAFAQALITLETFLPT